MRELRISIGISKNLFPLKTMRVCRHLLRRSTSADKTAYLKIALEKFNENSKKLTISREECL
jgi:hypothetical protein